MRRRLAWLFASGLTAGACAMPPEAEVIGGLPCDPQGACPAGYSCLASKCVQSGSAVEGTGGSSAKEAGTHVDSGTPPGSGGGGTGGSGDGGSGLSGSGGATLDASDRDVSVGTRDAAVDASEASVVDTGTGGVGAGGAGTGGTGAGGIGAGGAGTGGKGTGGVGAGGVGAGGAGTGGTGSGGSPGAGVVCGTMICAAGTHCCFPSSGTPTCSVSTCSSGSTTIACDGPEDCPPGDKCCQSSSGGNQTYGCKTQCGLGDVPIGCSSQNCPAGDVCCEETSGFRTTDTVCSTGCTGLISYTLCMSNADCPGSSCQPATLLVGFRRCN